MSRTLTYALLVFVMFTWGLNVVAIKFLVLNMPPIMMQSMRIFLAGLVTVLTLYVLKDLRKMTKREWLYTFLAALLGQVAHHAFLALGLIETTSSNASLILGLIPLTTAILASIFLKEKLSKLKMLGIVLGFIGVAFVVLQNGQGLSIISRGDLIIFASMLSQAFSFILIKKVTSTLSPKQMTAVMLLIGSVVLLGISFLFEAKEFNQITEASSLVWIVLVLSAVLATGLGHLLYNEGIHRIGAEQTAIFNNLVPFFALVGAYIFLGETILFSQILGFILIVAGVLLGTGYVEERLMKNRLSTTGHGPDV